jgi:mono/diheme cytochrome c family protein
MRAALAALPTAAVLLGVSWVSAPQAKENGKDGSVYAELGKAPEKARAKRNPLEKDPQAVSAGQILFQQHCAECHGNTAEGGKKGPNLRVEGVQSASPGAIFWILTNGVVRRGMPVWSKLPVPQRWQLVSYIKSLGAASAPPGPPQATAARDLSSPPR